MKKIELNITNKIVNITSICGPDTVDPIFKVIDEELKKQFGIDYWSYEEPAFSHEELEGILVLKPEEINVRYEGRGLYFYQSNARDKFTIQFELGPIHNKYINPEHLFPEYDITVNFNGKVNINVSGIFEHSRSRVADDYYERRIKQENFLDGLNWLLNSDENKGKELLDSAFYSKQGQKVEAITQFLV